MPMDLTEHAKKGPRLSYYNAEFVVALKHLGQVTEVLQHCGVRVEGVDECPDLDLALVTLTDDEAAATSVDTSLHKELDKLKRPARHRDPQTVHTELDRFLFGFRELFSLRNAGWCPLVGKNRLVGDVGGVGKISHGGDDMPTRTDQRLRDRSERVEEDLGEGVRVGLLDTSITAHEWLAGGWVSPPRGLLAERPVQARPAGHATFVAGLVLSQAPACVIESRNVLSDDFGQATSWDTAKAIAQIGKTRPDVLNLSFACYTEDGQAPLALATAIEGLDPSTVVVAAAGNHGNLPLGEEWDVDDRRKPAWPAALDRVVAIGAATAGAEPAPFMPHGVQWVDAMARGQNVVSTFVTGSVDVADAGAESDPEEFDGWAAWSGTSFSAALVSGVIAASTKPGKVSSRQAWETILKKAKKGQPRPPLVELRWPVPEDR